MHEAVVNELSLPPTGFDPARCGHDRSRHASDLRPDWWWQNPRGQIRRPDADRCRLAPCIRQRLTGREDRPATKAQTAAHAAGVHTTMR